MEFNKEFNKEISEFLSEKTGGVAIINMADSSVAYKSENVSCNFIDECPVVTDITKVTEWEYLDIDTKKYYKCYSSGFAKDNVNYTIHFQSDITEYMSLNRDVTKYMSFFKKLSSFQTAVLEHLSNTYYELLSMLSEYFKSEKAFFLIERNDKLDIITYDGKDKIYNNDRIEYDDEINEMFTNGKDGIILADIPERLKGIISVLDYPVSVLCMGNALGQNYAIVFPMTPSIDKESMGQKTLVNVTRLFVENTILREKLVYDSEHDSLTGLYNKGKYLSMVEQTFPCMNSLAIFNFDVNDLKIMNDTYGHEAGDKLLIKAADSIRKVVNSKTFGFRMGGDEFLMVAVDVTEEEVEQTRLRWQEELARLNERNDGINCVIALGVAYSKAPYSFTELSKEADALMYEDKKIKKGGREIR